MRTSVENAPNMPDTGPLTKLYDALALERKGGKRRTTRCRACLPRGSPPMARDIAADSERMWATFDLAKRLDPALSPVTNPMLISSTVVLSISTSAGGRLELQAHRHALGVARKRLAMGNGCGHVLIWETASEMPRHGLRAASMRASGGKAQNGADFAPNRRARGLWLRTPAAMQRHDPKSYPTTHWWIIG